MGLPLLAVSLCYLVIAFLEMIPDVTVGPGLLFLDGAFWLVFLVDYAIRVFLLAPQPWRYARTPLCILDLVVLASFPLLFAFGMGVFGLARIGRIVVQLLRATRSGSQLARTVGQSRRVFRRRNLGVVLGAALAIVVLTSVLVWRFETARPESPMQTWHQAAWWAAGTLMTVSYGDVYPTTPEGKIASVFLMVVGITLFGWVTASLASLFVEADERPARERRRLLAALEEISARLAALEARLEPVDENEPLVGVAPTADDKEA
jgi:voltage-gated potassium channel